MPIRNDNVEGRRINLLFSVSKSLDYVQFVSVSNIYLDPLAFLELHHHRQQQVQRLAEHGQDVRPMASSCNSAQSLSARSSPRSAHPASP